MTKVNARLLQNEQGTAVKRGRRRPTSSTNMMTGANLLAKEKRALVNFSASPNHWNRAEDVRTKKSTPITLLRLKKYVQKKWIKKNKMHIKKMDNEK